MSERAKVLLYTVLASALLFVGVERFLGTTDEYASRLDIRNTPVDPNWNPENEIVNAQAPTNVAAPLRAQTDPNASMDGTPTATSGEGAEEDEELPPEHDEDEERLTVEGTERADSDGDMEEETMIVVAGMSPEEAALLERIDGELLRTRAPTRALDLVLAGCTVSTDDEANADERVVTARPNLAVGILFRHGSVAIKGASLNRVDALVERFRRCDTGLLVVRHNPEGRVDIDDDARLVTRREEELKYYLLQRRVPSDLTRFPESS